MRRGLWLQDAMQDVRISACAACCACPMLVATVVATVGLGIGATTAMFGVVDATLLRPLPYADPDRLVRIYTDAPPNRFPFSVADYLALQEQQTQFERSRDYRVEPWPSATAASPSVSRGASVTWTLFRRCSASAPRIGRAFTRAGRPAGQPADGDRQPRVLAAAPRRAARTRSARPIRLDGSDYALVGVLPPAAGPAGAGAGVLRGRAMGHPAAQGPLLHHRARTSAARRGPIGGGRASCGPSTSASFRCGRASYQDEKASWGLMGLKQHVIRDVGHRRQPRAGGGGPGLADRLRQRLQPADRPRDEPPPRAGRACGARGLARARGSLPARGERPARAGRRRGGTRAGVGRASGCCGAYGRRLHPARPGNRARRARAVAAGGPDGRQRSLFGLVPAMHGTGGPVDESLRSLGRSSTGSLAVRRLRRVLVGGQFAIATPLLVAAGLLAGQL